MSTDDELTDQLWQRLPWLMPEPEYIDLRDQWGDESPGAHVAYGDVLVPVVARLLRQNPSNDERLGEAFRFVEELAESPEERVSEVAVVTVLEGLHGIRDVREAALRWMGPVSRQFAKSISDAWGT